MIEVNLERKGDKAREALGYNDAGSTVGGNEEGRVASPVMSAGLEPTQEEMRVEANEKIGSQKKKGWKKKAREGGLVSREGLILSGMRRKIRDDEMMENDELQEGETCGIKKKIGLDITVMTHTEEFIINEEVASPTKWALRGQ